MKLVAAKFWMVFCSLFIGLLLLELIVRPIYGIVKPYGFESEDPQEDIRYGVFDSRGFWTWKPNFRGSFDNGIDFWANRVTTNFDGGRNVPCRNGRGVHSSRVFLIGDSQTFGWGLSDSGTWANQLQCELERKRPGEFEVINLGFPGVQVDQLYARGLGQVEPATGKGDIVVVSFTWNDLVTYYAGKKFADQALRHAGLQEVKIADINRAKVQPLKIKSIPTPSYKERRPLEIQLLEPKIYLGELSWRYPIYKKYGIFIPAVDSAMSFLNSLQYISSAFRVAWSNARILYYTLRPKDALAKKIPAHNFRSNFLVLKALDTRLRRKGAKVLIQLLPSRLFFDDNYYNPYSKGGASFPDQDYLGFVSNPLCLSLQLTCLNRYENLITATQDRYTFPVDGHYNETGAAKIAMALARDLLK